MAAKPKPRKAEAPKTRKAVKAKRVVSKVAEVVTRKTLSNKQKLIVIGGVLVLALLLISGKELFVAATVNGVPVSRLEVVRELERQGGKQVLDSIVDEKLIEQEAKKSGVTVSEDDMNRKIDEIKKQVEGQGQNLDSLLELQGISQDAFRKQIRTQIYLEKLLSDKVSVTDEDVAGYIETYMADAKDMSDEEKQEAAREQLRQQKLSAEFSAWLSEIKQKANINYIVDY